MEERVENGSKKKGNVLILLLVLSIIIILGLVGYIFYDKKVLIDKKIDKKQCEKLIDQELKKVEKSDNKSENTENEQAVVTKKPKCYGVYYGERSGTQANGISYNEKFTYTLKEDGTFEANYGDVSGSRGVYTINGNTISLTGTKETAGPVDKATQYKTGDFVIADDCSYILYDNGESGLPEFKLNKR